MVHQSYLLCRKHGIQNRIFMLERTLRVAYSIHSHSPIRWGASDMCRACSRSQSWLVSDPALSPGLLAPCPGLLLLHQLTLFHCIVCFIEQQSKSGGQYLLVYHLTLSCRTWILAYTWVPTEGQGWLNSCSFHSFSKYLWSPYSVPGTTDPTMNMTIMVLSSQELLTCW